MKKLLAKILVISVITSAMLGIVANASTVSSNAKHVTARMYMVSGPGDTEPTVP